MENRECKGWSVRAGDADTRVQARHDDFTGIPITELI